MFWVCVVATLSSTFPNVLSPETNISSTNTPTRPQISPQFYANVTLSQVSPFDSELQPDRNLSSTENLTHDWFVSITKDLKARPAQNATWFVDGKQKSSLLATTFNMQIFLPCWRNTSTYAFSDSGYLLNNDACAQLPGSKFSDVWGWIALADYSGKASFAGRSCDLWAYNSPDLQFNGTVCVSSDDPTTPLVLVVSIVSSFYPGMATAPQTTVSAFNTFTAAPPPATVFELPESCTSPPVTCKDQGVATMDMFLAHPHELFNLTGQNSADMLGDVTFTCQDVTQNRTQRDGYDVISHVRVQVSTKWSQYAPCNGYPSICLGPEHFLVGREAAYGCGDALSGRCAESSEVGFWFSLTAGGECHGKQSIHDGECSWKLLERVKTVTMDCVFDTHEMYQQCLDPSGEDGALVIFDRAFASDDVSDGGCPDVKPAH
eukprot:c10806_g1_i1.p1 GENE.c10806_g1_i1~~c10806_g1_i1.p1  ORF type:complete len:442 (+),score=73.98 c10806_g1_i1:29-1327(+)